MASLKRLKQSLITLRSSVKGYPDLVVQPGEDVDIGRNSRCKITDVRCPKVSVTIRIETGGGDGIVLKSTNKKTMEETVYKDGEVLKGPGYSYTVELEDSKSGPAKKKLMSNDFQWEFDEKAQVHVCKFLGGGEALSQIAAFDFDGTLSVAKSGFKFPKDGTDFKLLDKKLPTLIGTLCADGPKRFVMFSNQLGILTKAAKLEHVKERFEGIMNEIKIPCLAFIAIANNFQRKPRPGMFHLLEAKYNDGIVIDKSSSLYVGDAAGRKGSKPKDHSAADVLLSINLDLPFQTPEQFIAKKPIRQTDKMDMKDFTLPPFNPRSLKDKSVPFATEVIKKQEIRDEEAFKLSLKKIINESEHVLLVMVGLPGSGKSTIVKNLLLDLGFDRISRDELKSMDKCEKKVSAVFAECPKKKKVLIAIDNTSHDTKSRKKWLDISKKFKASSVAVHIDIDKYHAIHNNMYRFLSSSLKGNSGEPVAASVPPMVIFKQANEFEPPTEKEGFDFVFKTRFTPTFSAEGDEELYFMFLSEK